MESATLEVELGFQGRCLGIRALNVCALTGPSNLGPSLNLNLSQPQLSLEEGSWWP